VESASAKDLEEICRLMDSAFETAPPHGHEISSQAASRLVRGLINDGDVLFSLVARSELILGSVFVSRFSLVPDAGLRCAGIAPLTVLPKFQSSGIGMLLMQAAIRLSSKNNLDALFLLGGPAYYKRFGFTVSRIGNDYGSGHFQELALTEGCLSQLSCRRQYTAAFSEPAVE
jgi:putative acetyltransferase